ncbi:hypothetical protein LOC67_17255 [Stieleria sp. JC731]|uniref:hypothetical protein n=1 Tax=Pirellulaceae TaxID=2691357 RepID=UPI001E2E21D6|nr:hypothetical protein [Stieleria sp. JC731]MCC9602305.1 hypothetical protein [Stieleria sp. JC731]
MTGVIAKGKIALGAVGYVCGTFPLAVVWHVVLFGDTYESLGYFGGEPLFLLGLTAIVTQGILLSIGYAFVFHGKYTTGNAFGFAAFVGLFFWTSHVLAAAAKNQFTSITQFILLESIYMVLQFAIFGCVISLLYRGRHRH